MPQSREQLLQAHAALPEAYQPAWGLPESHAVARRSCEDRLAVVLAALGAFPEAAPLRILDIGCAQGYFSLGLEFELRQRGRMVEVVGVDSLRDNVDFCAALAGLHGLSARFIHDRFDAGFLQRHKLQDFDCVLALNVLHHIRELDGPEAAEAALTAIRIHSSVLLCELAQREEALDWVNQWHASDDALLQGYAFRRTLGRFGTHLTQVPRPLYVCSSAFAYVGNKWFPFDHVLDRAHSGVPDRFANQRRFFIGRESVAKSCRANGDFGEFNKAEFAAEVEVLTALGDEPSRYPPLLAQADDGDELWLVRGALPGVLVSELVERGAKLDRESLVGALLGELAHLQERGYYHADLRAWNMLWHEGGLRLIDFGSMSRDASPLNRVALAAVLAEIARGELTNEQPWYQSLHPLETYPPGWHALIGYLLGSPQRQFRFEQALNIFAQGANAPMAAGEVFPACSEILTACTQAQLDGFVRLQNHVEDLERSFRQAQAHATDLGRSLRKSEWALADAGAYANSLLDQISRETAGIANEREASQAALADAAAYAHSLENERAGLKEEVKRLQSELDRMRRRFRLLKSMWPREDGNKK